MVAAGHFISMELCGSECDDEVRQLYPEGDYSLSDLIESADDNDGFKCPAAGGEWEGTGFTGANCEAALAELEREYQWSAT